jgi:Cu-Zn family superoxide dismutase
MIKSNLLITSLFFVFIMTLNYGCSEKPNETSTAISPSSDSINQQKATAILAPTTGNTAAGSVYFSQQSNGIQIKAEFTGLTPGPHGFHIHEKGDCSSGDGKSAGGHFNPNSVDHGSPDTTLRHIGDLGNITADDNGNAVYERLDTVVSFSGTNNIIRKGVIIHAGTDDLTSQPTGAAGARVSCGVITERVG